MDKFGIFNLLSALTSLRREREETPPPPQQKTDAVQQDAEARKQRACTFLERHAAISRRIDKKNR